MLIPHFFSFRALCLVFGGHDHIFAAGVVVISGLGGFGGVLPFCSARYNDEAAFGVVLVYLKYNGLLVNLATVSSFRIGR